MPLSDKRRANSHVWLGADVRELALRVARAENRTLSNYIYFCVLTDLFKRGLVDYTGEPVAPFQEEKELVHADGS